MMRFLLALLLALAPLAATAQTIDRNPPITVAAPVANDNSLRAAPTSWVNSAISSAVSGKVSDAASDGRYYLRRNGTWTAFGGPRDDAPNDGQVYGRSGGSWAAIGGSGASASVTNASVLSALGYTPVSKAGDTLTGPLQAGANTIGASTRNFPNRPSNQFFVSGSGPQLSDCNNFENCQTKSTDTTFVQALVRSLTQQGTTIAENTLSLDTYANTGYSATPGSGDKVGFSNLMQIGPNGGHTWGSAENLIIGVGAQTQFAINKELDVGNLAKPCLSRIQCHNLWLYGDTVYPLTAHLDMSSPETTPTVGVPTTWAPSTAYRITPAGNQGAPIVKNGANYYYQVRVDDGRADPYLGTSATSGGPTGTTPNVDIVDGTVHWRWYDPEFQNSGHDTSPYLGGAAIYGTFLQGLNLVREAAFAESTGGRYGWYSDDGAKHVATLYDRSHSDTGINLAGVYTDSALKTNGKVSLGGFLNFDNTQTPVVDLYTAPPTGSWIGMTAGGPRMSMAPIGGHAPGDSFRSQFTVESKSGATAATEETAGLFEMEGLTGYARRWVASTAFSAGQQIRGPFGSVYQAASNCTSGTSGPSVTSGSQTDGSCTWNYVGVGAGTNKSAALFTCSASGAMGGDCWGMSVMSGRKNGAWPNNDGNAYGVEIDMGNQGADCPPGVYNGCQLMGLFLNANGDNQSTVGIGVGGERGFHIGIQGFATPNGTQDTFIADASNSVYGFNQAGTKTGASYRDGSTSPAAFLLQGTYANYGIQDTSTVGTFQYIHGAHSFAGIYDDTSANAFRSGGTHTGAAFLDASTTPYGLRLMGSYASASIAGPGFAFDPSGNLTAAGLTSNGNASVAGTATVGALSTSGAVTATGTVTGGNISTGGTVTGNKGVFALGIRSSVTSPSNSAACTQGEITTDNAFIYVCISTGHYRRAALVDY